MMKIPFSPPDMTEEEARAAWEAILSGWITTGPRTKEFERRIEAYCGVEKVACLNSATAAMELCLRELGVGPGDEVITSAYTYSASASVIDHVGARIVLVDTLPGSMRMDMDAVGAAITVRTKAVIPVDVAGIPADYAALRAAIEAKKELFRPSTPLQEAIGRVAIIADAAHSFGARYRGAPAAQAPDFCCFSFHAVKNLTTAEGGAIAFSGFDGFDAQRLYSDFMLWSLHGQSKDALAKTQLGAWEYDIVYPGYKCNMTDIMAAIGLAQLDRYEGMLARRREMVARYDAAFAGSRVRPLAHSGEDFDGSHHLYITQIEGTSVEERNRLIVALAQQGISTNVHYKPLPMFTAYRKLGFDIANYPNAYDYYTRELTLPLHTLLTDEQIDAVADTLLELLRA